MNAKRYAALPISYCVGSELRDNDMRFLNVTIDVLHLGINSHGSIFSKEVVEQNLVSICNTPILGYIDGTDFEQHEYAKKINVNGELVYAYAGSAYGVIPESCNPRWITKVSSDGETREYLQVDALLWTKVGDAFDIFKRDVVKYQSMELDQHSMEGFMRDDGLFEFTSFQFDGCCVLSTSNPRIQPAMIDSIAAAHFSIESAAQEIRQRLHEYAAIADSQNDNNGDISIVDKNHKGGSNKLEEKLALLEKHGISQQQLEDKGINLEEISMDELEKAIAEMTKEQEKPAADHSQAGEPEDHDPPTNYTDGESSGSEDDGKEPEPDAKTYTQQELDDALAALQTELDEKLAQLNVKLGDAMQQLSTAQEEVASLTSYRQEREEADREAAESQPFAQFDKDLSGSAAYASLKQTSKDYTLEQIQEKCFAI